MDLAEYRRTIEEWRQARAQRLQQPDGWLSLVDRILLDEGDNQLPFGTIRLRGGVAHLQVHPDAVVTCDGQPVSERSLKAEEGGASDVLSYQGRTYELFRRSEVFAVRVKDPQSPARLAFAGLSHFPLDLAWRIVARFEPYHPPRHTLHQFDIGSGLPRQVPGIARFQVAGRALALEPVLEEDSQRLFFVFADETNRDETYPAGRFLNAALPSGDEVVLDFNTAFNPPCAFTPFATCPITPAQNRLPVRVTAGERRYGEEP